MSDRYGTDRLAGPIFNRKDAPADGEVVEMDVFAHGFAAGEAEFLLRIGAAPPAGKSDYSLDEAADLIEAVHVGIEVASSPLGTINELGPIAVISDFGNNNGLVIGPEVADWRQSGFETWTVETLIDGDQVGTGRAAAFPDGAIGAARFLFELMARRGIALAPGQWISSGAVTGVHPARPGQAVRSPLRRRCRGALPADRRAAGIASKRSLDACQGSLRHAARFLGSSDVPRAIPALRPTLPRACGPGVAAFGP